MLSEDKHNKSCLHIVDNALFVVCLDDTAPDSLADLCNNFLCGTYNLQGGEQVGTCTNRWYDKVCFFGSGFAFWKKGIKFAFGSFKSSCVRMAQQG